MQYVASASPSRQESRHLGTPQPAPLGHSGRREEKYEFFSKLKLKAQTSDSHCIDRNCMAETFNTTTPQSAVQSSWDLDIAISIFPNDALKGHLVGVTRCSAVQPWAQLCLRYKLC